MNAADETSDELIDQLSECRGELSRLAASLKRCSESNEELRQSEERYRLMVQAVQDYAIFVLDPEGHIVSWNRGANIIKGFEADEVLGRHFSCLFPGEQAGREKGDRSLKWAAETGRFEDEGWRVRKDGTKFWAHIVITALHNEEGLLRGFTKVTRDLTRFKQIEANLQTALEAKEVLLREVHHRVRNNLQVMSSLLRLQARYAHHEPICGILNDTQSRIQSMAIVHELLYESEDMERVNRKEYLSRIVRHLYRSFGVDPSRIAATVRSEEIKCAIEIAVTLGLIINELVSNCLKHAFPNGRNGEINVSVERLDGEEIELVVSDNGVGITDEIDLQNPGTFGLYLVTTLVRGLHGQVELKNRDGLEVRVRLAEIDSESKRTQ